jgi:cobalt-zinc-cadmium efflux system outer membrane protein
MHLLVVLLALCFGAQSLAQLPEAASLHEVLTLSLRSHPALEAERAKIRAAEARYERAGFFPNPTGSFELENFAGTGTNKSFSNTEITLAFSQLVELGNKRKRRSRVANADIELATANYRRTRVDILTRVAVAFIELLAAEYQLRTDIQLRESAEKLYKSVSANVEAGKVAPVEEVKANVELSRARLSELKTSNAIIALRARLAAVMGHQVLPIDAIFSDLFDVARPQPIEEIYAKLDNSPDIERQQALITKRQDSVALAKSQQIPDVSVSAGLRRFEASDDTAAVAMFSIPLFLFDNKDTLTVEADANLTEALAAMSSLQFRLRSELAIAYQLVSANVEEFFVMQKDVVPSAEIALYRVNESYRLGKLSLIDLIDSQRTLFNAKRQLVQSAAQYHIASIQLESLVGGAFIAESTIEEGDEQ